METDAVKIIEIYRQSMALMAETCAFDPPVPE